MRAWRPPSGTRAWWSAGPSPGCAGVGIIVQLSFLAQFLAEPRWTVIWPGRAAILSLRGAAGALDIIVTCCHTGGAVTELDKSGVHPTALAYCSTFPRLREHMRMRLAEAIQPRSQVLTLLAGDFN